MAAETEESPFARVALIVVAVLALYVLSIRSCLPLRLKSRPDASLVR
jgi:hypothetical protein